MPEQPFADGLTTAVPRQLPDPGPDPAAARAAMVARLEEEGALHPGPVRDALLDIPREVLMRQGYVRRTALDELPVQWQLLDWSVPADRVEHLDTLHCGESVLIQHDGEPLLGRDAGVRRTGGTMTSMSSGMFMTAVLMEQLALRPGLRVADVGTGAAVTCAIAARICGDQHVVSIDRDPHVTEAARHHLAALGLHPTLVTGDGEAGFGQRWLPSTGSSPPTPSPAYRRHGWSSWHRVARPCST